MNQYKSLYHPIHLYLIHHKNHPRDDHKLEHYNYNFYYLVYRIDGIFTSVFPVVDKLLNTPVEQFREPFIVPLNTVIFPKISKVVDGFVVPIPNLLFELSHIKFDDCKIDVEPLQIDI